MKRKSAALVLILVIAMIAVSCVSVFADGLSIEEVKPEDGKKNLQVTNIAMKVSFSEDMTANEEIIDSNLQYFHVTDSEGNEITNTAITYNAKKYPNQLWILVNDTLNANSTYTFTVDPGVVSASGNTLSEGFTSTFSTRNTKMDSRLNWILMVGMMVVMFIGTSISAKKQAEKENDAYRVAKMNPYKIAKEKGISVEEAQALIDKEKEKVAKAQAKKAAEEKKRQEAKEAEMAAIQARIEAEEAVKEKNTYTVARRASVREAGGRIPRSVLQKSKEKKEAEKQKAKEAAKNKSKK